MRGAGWRSDRNETLERSQDSEQPDSLDRELWERSVVVKPGNDERGEQRFGSPEPESAPRFIRPMLDDMDVSERQNPAQISKIDLMYLSKAPSDQAESGSDRTKRHVSWSRTREKSIRSQSEKRVAIRKTERARKPKVDSRLDIQSRTGHRVGKGLPDGGVAWKENTRLRSKLVEAEEKLWNAERLVELQRGQVGRERVRCLGR